MRAVITDPLLSIGYPSLVRACTQPLTTGPMLETFGRRVVQRGQAAVLPDEGQGAQQALEAAARGRGELVDAVVAVAAGPAHVSRAAARGGGRDCDRAQARRGVGGRRRRLDSPASLRASPSL